MLSLALHAPGVEESHRKGVYSHVVVRYVYDLTWLPSIHKHLGSSLCIAIGRFEVYNGP